MEALAHKRDRLRRDLQKAYAEWMVVSELVVPQGGREATKVKWSAYLAAKGRLVAAYAESAAAA